MRYISKDNLKEGMILATTLYDRHGNRLLAPNVVLTGTYINRIRNMNFEGVYIFDELSSSIIGHQVISQQTYQQSIDVVSGGNYDDCMLAANCIVEDLLSSESVLPNMTSIASYDRSTFTHSMNVAVVSAIVAMESGYCARQLREVAAAGLLHDIGKSMIPESVLNKPGRLTDEETRLLHQHPQNGFDMLKNYSTIPAVVKHAVLHHHENYDGSGYPFGKTGDQIHQYARLIHVTDVWDALITKRCYKDACCPVDALDYIMNNKSTMFDPVFADALYNSVHPFSTGITVELSNGENAVVAKNYKGNPVRPDVIVISTRKYMKLTDHPDIVIAKIAV
mgnify:FL=1